MILALACAVAIAAILIPTVWAASGTPAPPWLARLIHAHRQRSYRMTDATPYITPNPLGPMAEQAATAAVRHIITGIAGAAVTAGVLTAPPSDPVVQYLASAAIGAAIWAVGYGWSIIQKRFTRRVVQGVAASRPQVVGA